MRLGQNEIALITVFLDKFNFPYGGGPPYVNGEFSLRLRVHRMRQRVDSLATHLTVGRGRPMRMRRTVCGNYRRDIKKTTTYSLVTCYRCRRFYDSRH